MLKKVFIALALLFAGAVPALATNNLGFVFEQNNTSVASVTSNICGSATAPATYAGVQAQGATVYYTADGTVPSSSNGFSIASGGFVGFYGQTNINALKFIGAGATITVLCTE
jgi:hypothetical protein